MILIKIKEGIWLNEDLIESVYTGETNGANPKPMFSIYIKGKTSAFYSEIHETKAEVEKRLWEIFAIEDYRKYSSKNSSRLGGLK